MTDAKLLLYIVFNLTKFEATGLQANLEDFRNFSVTEFGSLICGIDSSIAEFLLRTKGNAWD